MYVYHPKTSSILIALKRVLLATLLISLSACQTLYSDSELQQSQQARELALNNVNDWLIRGKIAFISSKEKQSANLYWRRDNQSQQLKLTTFLGINVFSLHSENGLHTLNIDGKRYQHTDLNYLIQQLAGFPLPVEALSYWLKGLTYNDSDKIAYNANTLLPSQLSAAINGTPYVVDYQSYTLVNNLRLANKFNIRYQDMRIKLAISQWELL